MPLASTSWRSSHRRLAMGVFGVKEEGFSSDVLLCFSRGNPPSCGNRLV